MTIVGREEETQLLEKISFSSSAEFVALYGRRRVGKTFLIREFFKSRKDSIFLNVTGTKSAPMREQLAHFSSQVSETFYQNPSLMKPAKNWDEAFSTLTTVVKNTKNNKKIVFFFDELPWMATHRSRLLETLDYYWNQHWSTDKRLKLIVCGSSASWIINKLIHNRGGLHNRITHEIHLQPFNLSQTQQFLHQRGIKLDNQQILQLYMALGGIPFYLDKIEKGFSATQSIEALAFSPRGFLLTEFDKLFASLFDNPEEYLSLIKLLAEHRYGIGERKLLENLGRDFIGAKGKRILDELEQTGFIMGFKPLYHKVKGTYYRLVDEYSFFYLKWIAPIKDALSKKSLEKGYWQNLQSTPEWYAWQGYAFESVCYKHLIPIRKALNLLPTALPSTWRYAPNPGTKEQGAQIDLLFDRRDNAITLCEIKYTAQAFSVNKDYADKLLKKIAVFKKKTRTKKQLFIALISVNGLQNNYYSDDIITKVVTLDALFNAF